MPAHLRPGDGRRERRALGDAMGNAPARRGRPVGPGPRVRHLRSAGEPLLPGPPRRPGGRPGSDTGRLPPDPSAEPSGRDLLMDGHPLPPWRHRGPGAPVGRQQRPTRRDPHGSGDVLLVRGRNAAGASVVGRGPDRPGSDRPRRGDRRASKPRRARQGFGPQLAAPAGGRAVRPAGAGRAGSP